MACLPSRQCNKNNLLSCGRQERAQPACKEETLVGEQTQKQGVIEKNSMRSESVGGTAENTV